MNTINDLKKQLGPGLGLRKNKYLLELPIPGLDGAQINALARTAGFPERTIKTTTMAHKGRTYNVRGETDYGGTFVVSVVDDSNMSIRRKMDEWLRLVDDSKPKNMGLFSGGSYETGISSMLSNIKSGVSAANKLKNITKSRQSMYNAVGNFFLGVMDAGGRVPVAKYQTDINIWQLSGTEHKVYGYRLQNAFPTQIGTVSYDDAENDSLTSYDITFTYSEFLPLEGISMGRQLVNSLIGQTGQDIIVGIETLVK